MGAGASVWRAQTWGEVKGRLEKRKSREIGSANSTMFRLVRKRENITSMVTSELHELCSFGHIMEKNKSKRFATELENVRFLIADYT